MHHLSAGTFYSGITLYGRCTVNIDRDFCKNPCHLEKVMCPDCDTMIPIYHMEKMDDNANWWLKVIIICKCGWNFKKAEPITGVKEVIF